LKFGGKVLGIDLDDDAINYVKEKWVSLQRELNLPKDNLVLEKGNFRDIDRIALLNNFKKVKGIILDLGVSSHQIDEASRGFSFLRSGPLDMRMDQLSSTRAADLLNILKEGQLYEIFSKLGQERHARSISNNIVRARKLVPIETTDQLVDLIREGYGIRKKELNSFEKNLIAQKVFQGLRIIVNNELENLEEAIPKAISLLEKGGKLIIISFHSLEDKIVKDYFKKMEKNNKGTILTNKVIVSKQEELIKNRRSHSAKLRAFQVN
jgi:16S rRNA (cytosine1402-N4)-methyltransferase